MKSCFRRLLSLLLSAVLVCTLTAAYAVSAYVDDYVYFGHYPQTEKGLDRTPIEWLVLDVKDNKLLLISRYILDCMPY